MLPLFGSIAGAESVLLAFEEDLRPSVVMTEAPHGTAPSLQGKDVANPMAMILACAAVMDYAGRRDAPGAGATSSAIYHAVLSAVGDGIATFDLGGHSSTTEFTTEVVARTRSHLRP